MLSSMTLHVQLVIVITIASGLSLSAGQKELEKQIALLKIKLDRQDVELKELKNITSVQNKKLSILKKLNEDLQQKLLNQSVVIGDLQNQQEQLENLTYLSQSKIDFTEQDGSGLEQEIYELFNTSKNQQRQIEYFMDQGEELRKNGTKLRQMMEAEIDEVDIRFLNITDNHYEKFENFTKHMEKLQNGVQVDQKNSNQQISVLSKNQMQIKSIIEDGGKCKWLRQDDGVSFSKPVNMNTQTQHRQIGC